MYFVWSIHAFVMVTMALAAKSSFDTAKILRRIAYVAFVYIASVFVFAPLFMLSGKHVPLRELFFNPFTVFIENPYFGHLWYICLYAQILFFLLFFLKPLRKLSPMPALAGAFIISQGMFVFTHYGLGALESLLLPSWFFVMAAGFYFMPELVQKMQSSHATRRLRAGVALLLLIFFYTHHAVYPWLATPQNRVFALNTFVFLLSIYFLSEVYFFVRAVRWFKPLIQFVVWASRYTLSYYIFHQGIYKFFEYRFPDADRSLLALVCLATGLAYGYGIHESYLWLERKIASAKRTKREINFSAPA